MLCGVQAAQVREAAETAEETPFMYDAVGHLARIQLVANAEQPWETLVEAQRVLSGGHSIRYPRLILALAGTYAGYALLVLHQPAQALGVVHDWVVLPEHAVCEAPVRAIAELQLGHPGDALVATRECVEETPAHNLRPLPTVRLTRAVALDRLDELDRADAEFAFAAHLAVGLGSPLIASGIPSWSLDRLLARLAAHEPGIASRASAHVLWPDRGAVRPDPSWQEPRLTSREAVLAGWLTTDLTLAKIADRLFISVNTVKTQAASIYRKLGVTSRSDAARRLRSLGLDADPDGVPHNDPHTDG